MRKKATTTALLLAASMMMMGTNTAGADTKCTLAGPTPGFKAIKLSLPNGTGPLGIGLELNAARSTRPVNDGTSWHFARGIMLLDSDLNLLSYRIENSGSVPPRTVIETDGTRVAEDVGPVNGPFVHSDSKLLPSLPPGDYYAVAFGTDGDSRVPNEYWSADVRAPGNQSCDSVASGEIVDIDHTDFEGGTQIYSSGLGYAEDADHSFETSRQLVVGLIDASAQFDSQASLSYSLADGQSAIIEDELVPLATSGGLHQFTASYFGAFPVINISGVALTLNL